MGWLHASLSAILVFGRIGFAGPAQEKWADKGANTALETCTLPPSGPAATENSGRCELAINHEMPVSCTRIQMLLYHGGRAAKKYQERAAVIDGLSFKFTDLT